MCVKKLISGLALTAMMVTSGVSYAVPVDGDTCPGAGDGYERQGYLEGATKCAYGLGNPNADDINGYYGDTWDNAGELTGSGVDNYLTATSVSWGVIPNSGTWTIDPDFWTHYSSAVITIHVGNGNGDPDHWAWLIGDGVTNGTWSITKLDPESGGGGLSNIKLWGVEGSTSVPEPGMTALLGMGLLGIFFAARRRDH